MAGRVTDKSTMNPTWFVGGQSQPTEASTMKKGLTLIEDPEPGKSKLIFDTDANLHSFYTRIQLCQKAFAKKIGFNAREEIKEVPFMDQDMDEPTTKTYPPCLLMYSQNPFIPNPYDYVMPIIGGPERSEINPPMPPPPPIQRADATNAAILESMRRRFPPPHGSEEERRAQRRSEQNRTSTANRSQPRRLQVRNRVEAPGEETETPSALLPTPSGHVSSASSGRLQSVVGRVSLNTGGLSRLGRRHFSYINTPDGS